MGDARASRGQSLAAASAQPWPRFHPDAGANRARRAAPPCAQLVLRWHQIKRLLQAWRSAGHALANAKLIAAPRLPVSISRVTTAKPSRYYRYYLIASG